MTLTIGKTRVRVHPLALMFPALAALLGGGTEVYALLLSLTLHEAAHMLAAQWMHVQVTQLRLMPFGGAMHLGNPYALSPTQLFVVAIAGPLANLALLFVSAALCHWGLLPPFQALCMLQVNLCLLLYNLFPALPLDGGRMLYAALAPRLGRDRALQLSIILGYLAATVLTVLAIVLWIRVGRLNLSLLFAAVFLIASAPEERRALTDTQAVTLLNAVKPRAQVIPAQWCAVNADCSARTALRAARPDCATFYAVYRDTRLVGLTDERILLDAALSRPDATIGEVAHSTPNFLQGIGKARAQAV